MLRLFIGGNYRGHINFPPTVDDVPAGLDRTRIKCERSYHFSLTENMSVAIMFLSEGVVKSVAVAGEAGAGTEARPYRGAHRSARKGMPMIAARTPRGCSCRETFPRS